MGILCISEAEEPLESGMNATNVTKSGRVSKAEIGPPFSRKQKDRLLLIEQEGRMLLRNPKHEDLPKMAEKNSKFMTTLIEIMTTLIEIIV
jgi:hypothetical protein